MRYIDADKLQEAFKELHGGKRSLLIDTEPTADVRENIRGEWIVEDGEVVCSECGNPHTETNFCPFCGADMRGGDAE